MDRAKKNIITKVNISDSGCWEWTGCIQKNGYARVTYCNKTMGAHRLSYLAFVGDIPEKMDVCHSCDNRKCVNPSHLFIGTRKQNMEDCVKKNRQAKGEKLGCRKGSLSPASKLNEHQVLEIRELLKSGLKHAQIAKEFGVTADNISKIATGKTWSHI